MTRLNPTHFSALEFVDIAAELDVRSRGVPAEMPLTRAFADFLATFVALYEGARLPRFGPERLFANALHVALLNHHVLDEHDTDIADMFTCAKRLATELAFLSHRGFKQDLSELVRVRDVCLELSGRTSELKRFVS